MQRKQVINLYELKKSKKWAKPLRDMVIDYLGDLLYEITDEQEFVFQVMKRIHPVKRWVTDSPESIDKACNKVFSILKIRKGTVYEVNSEGKLTEITSPVEEITLRKKFMRTYLQLDTPPGLNHQKLKKIVEEDLKELNILIKNYESKPYIQELIQEGSKPRDHEQRILFDFYNRCITEQKDILDYYLNRLKLRAIAKSNYFPAGIKQMLVYSAPYKDRPYRFARRNLYTGYFESEKIDLVTNKVAGLLEIEGERFIRLYSTNKTKFYKKLLSVHKPAAIMQEIDYNLSVLPLKQDRRPIFKELEKLFKSKSWIGFYALALAQIEGLFSDIHHVIKPNVLFGKALPDKVQMARPFYDMSDYYFDYYQYHIPRLRNKFMHTGYEEDFKFKSYDLLFDLRYLCEVFHNLNNPLVKLNQILEKRDPDNFITYIDFAFYFELINNLEPVQRKEIAPKLIDFEKNFLMENTAARYVCLEVAQNFPVMLSEFSSKLEGRLSEKGSPVDLNNRNWPQVKDSIFASAEKLDALKYFFLFNHQPFEDLLAYKRFLSDFKKQLPSLQKEYAKQIDETCGPHLLLLKNITNIRDIVPLDNN